VRTEHTEEIVEHMLADSSLWSISVSERGVIPKERGCLFKCVDCLSPVREICRSHGHLTTLRVHFRNLNKAVSIPVRQRLQQDGVYDRELGGRATDAECEREDGNDRKAGRSSSPRRAYRMSCMVIVRRTAAAL
jgi:hypothetical protein